MAMQAECTVHIPFRFSFLPLIVTAGCALLAKTPGENNEKAPELAVGRQA
jgi:hypothetical protein